MDSTTTVWVVVAIAAILVIAALGFAAYKKRNQRRHVEAERIREDVTTDIAQVDKREALAEETAAKARAAEAEAEAKAAEGARLQAQASSRQESVATSREDLDERRREADRLDPKTRVEDEAGEQDAARQEAVRQEPQHRQEAVRQEPQHR